MSAPRTVLEEALSEFSPSVAAIANGLISSLCERLPGANLLIYDGYNALAVGFSATDKQQGIVFSVTVYPRWVSLFFPRGSELADPHELLKGSGKSIRHVVIDDLQKFDCPEVRDLVEQAIRVADPPVPLDANGTVLLKSVASKKRPRKP